MEDEVVLSYGSGFLAGVAGGAGGVGEVGDAEVLDEGVGGGEEEREDEERWEIHFIFYCFSFLLEIWFVKMQFLIGFLWGLNRVMCLCMHAH